MRHAFANSTRFAWTLLVVIATLVATHGADLCRAQPPEREKMDGHWGEDRVGFRWEEDDSVDNRWNQTQVGPFLTTALNTPSGMTPKALCMRVGEEGEGTICFDLARLKFRCGWTGGFLKFSPARYGVIEPPRIDGQVRCAELEGPAWRVGSLDVSPDLKLDYQGMQHHGNRIVLGYRVGETLVYDSPWLMRRDGRWVFTRTLQLGPRPQTLYCAAGAGGAGVSFAGDEGCRLNADANGGQWLRIPAGQQTIRVELQLDGGPVDSPEDAAGARFAPPPSPATPLQSLELSPLMEPGPLLWPDALETRGVVSRGVEPYVVDTLPLPLDNPWKALMFVGGHDFFSTPGRAAICTLHGDVWLVDGIDDSLERLSWRRFATGMFQPLGLKIVNDEIYVLGRDQITRLRDTNDDGQADLYDSFNHDADTSPGGHDYSACLETDAAGNFYYVSHRGVHRISADGSRYQTIATGLRNPIGLSVGPGDRITAAPQEGEWTPVSAVFDVRPGGYYGYGGPLPSPTRPLGYDPPWCWIPRRLDNSTGGQVWVQSDRWGPLQGQLLNLSYGQCRILLTLREEIDDLVQGGSLALRLNFESGIMRGRFSPHDGQLYVSGLRGWVSAAVQDGCLQRVRYTGAAVDLPVNVRTLANGVALTFTSPLDRSRAEDPGNYALQQWNYRYGEHYGSDEYRPSRINEVGRDDVEVLSATLLDDRTVFLELPRVEPVMQMAIRYALRSEDGRNFDDVYYHTIHRVRSEAIPKERLTAPPTDARDSEGLEQRLQPGFAWRFRQIDPVDGQSRVDARSQRLIALHVPAARAASALLRPEWFAAEGQGFLRVPLNGDYTFRLTGFGSARVFINGEMVIAGGGDLSLLPRRTAPLRKGMNQVEVFYDAPHASDAQLQLLWEHDSFPSEPPPPSELFHLADDPLLIESLRFREGRRVYAEQRCWRCHESPSEGATIDGRLGWMPELLQEAPRLAPGATPARAAWLAAWLVEPASMRGAAEMPCMLVGTTEQQRQEAADLAAWLSAEHQPPTNTDASVQGASDNSGEHPREQLADAVEQGGALADRLGCIGCHRFSDPRQADDLNRVSLALTPQKFTRAELAKFLRHPRIDDAWRKMPDFALNAEQSEMLAAWIEHRAQGELPPWTLAIRGDAARGPGVFQQRGCAQCHELPVAAAAPRRVWPIDVLGDVLPPHGCLAATAMANVPAPRYALDDESRSNLSWFLRHRPAAWQHDAPAEAAERLWRQWRCNACHDRDGVRSARPALLAEEGERGEAPEALPDLTWTGEKLHVDWMNELFQGRLTQPTRPWLAARMPSFPAIAPWLASGFAQQHGASESPEAVVLDAAQVQQGQRLAQQDALDCRQCHGVGDLQPRGDERTQLALGVNFAIARDRLRKSYYHRLVLDPPRYEPSSKMPKLSADGKTTKVAHILDGDARRQFEALWHYMHGFELEQPANNRSGEPSGERANNRSGEDR